jgi:hypothetical protein
VNASGGPLRGEKAQHQFVIFCRRLQENQVVPGITSARPFGMIMAFSSELDTGSRGENASKQESSTSVLIQSEPIIP